MSTGELVPTVFVVDDDEAVRSSLRLLLKSLRIPAVTHGSAAEFLAHYDPGQPGCIILDVRMPGMNGLELQDELNRRGAVIPVIFITGHGDVPMAVEAMQHGAIDFLQKPFSDKDLTERIERALAIDFSNRAVLGEKDQICVRLAALTPREREVLQLVALGKANKVISGDLGISQRTVEIHRAHLMEKMGANSLAQLVRMTMIAGMRISTY
ncbi:MAG: response regulator [Gammaproteobacteria bacterium]|nr:response regulator [Gammaproteobacteria bacterium]